MPVNSVYEVIFCTDFPQKVQPADIVSFLACDQLAYMSEEFVWQMEISEVHLREDVANKVCV